MSKAIGIDLGTTFSVAALAQDGRAEVIKNAEGERLTPSVFAETVLGRKLVGSVAKSQAAADPERTVFSIKRHMGTDYRASVNGRSYSPQEISAFILRKIKSDIEDRLGQQVERAVITVPAYFNDAQRQATKEAGMMAGFDVMRIINEPTAASLAYGLHRENIQTILVWDLGGGTFDVSILELGDGVFHVKAVSGNTGLGGDDWDERLVDHISEDILKKHGVDVRTNKIAFQLLKEAGEKAKRELSRKPWAKISLPFFMSPEGRITDLETSIDRETFERITADLMHMLLAPTRQALLDAGLSTGDIDRVVLVGGATRMPAIKALVEEIFNKKPYDKINPDEVVGIGAALQAGILTGEIRDVVLVDVTPLSLGVETQRGLFTRIIPRNSIIPASAAQIFTNADDNQTEMDIHVLQGEREMAADNISLGRFQLTDIPPLPRGKAQVEVTFDIDVNGIVKVSARDLHTETQTGIRIVGSHLLPDEQVQQVIREAEANAREDMKRREQAEIHIRADSMIRAAEWVLEERQGKLSKSHLQRIESGILDLKKAVAVDNSQVIEKWAKGLMELLDEM